VLKKKGLINPMHIGTSSKTLDISIEKDTKLIAQKLSKFLNLGDYVYFQGEVGVGKTTFIRYLINFLQDKYSQEISEIPSPTFNIVHEYKIKDFKILHYDLYRVKNTNELDNIGIFENNENSLVLVEWPELIKKKEINHISLQFKYEKNLKGRSITIITHNNRDLTNVF